MVKFKRASLKVLMKPMFILISKQVMEFFEPFDPEKFSCPKTRKVKVGYSPTANQIEADLAALLANL